MPDDALEAALRLFWEHGFEATSLQDIESRTGLSRSDLYNSFGSKRELFDRALEEYGRRGDELFVKLAGGTRGLEGIHDFVDRLVEQRMRPSPYRGCLMVNTMIEFGGQDAGVARPGKRYFGRVRDALARIRARREPRRDFDGGHRGCARDSSWPSPWASTSKRRSGATRKDLAALAAAAHDQIDNWRLQSAVTSRAAIRRSP